MTGAKSGCGLRILARYDVRGLMWAMLSCNYFFQTAPRQLVKNPAEAIVGAATALISFAVLSVLDGNAPSDTFEPEQLHALAGRFLDVRTAGLDIVLIFIGIGGTLFCYLLYKSKYIPRALAAWGIFTYLSMLFLALVSILFPNHPVMLETVLYGVGTFFELTFGLWLLFKGVDPEQWAKHALGRPSS